MNWYKEIIVDILVTLYIVTAVIIAASWMRYVLIGYTVLMLSVKLLVYFNDGFMHILKRNAKSVPAFVIYQIYGVNIAILILYDWWIEAGLWLLVGLISYLTEKKMYNQISTSHNKPG